MDGLIVVQNLVKEFAGHTFISKKNVFRAVDEVSLTIRRNTIFGLVGESGCGKTTLSRAILFLDPPTSGKVFFDGVDLTQTGKKQNRMLRKRMQIVFQDPNSALNPKQTIYKSLEEGLVNIGYPRGKRDGRVQELLELVGIHPDHRFRYPHEFSGGQKQRICVARALAVEPEFLILDEPVSNLDVSIQAQIINLLLDLKDKLNLTYMFISHDLNLISFLSDEIAVMYKGKIVENSSAEEILEDPKHDYTLKLFGSAPGGTGTPLHMVHSPGNTGDEVDQ